MAQFFEWLHFFIKRFRHIRLQQLLHVLLIEHFTNRHLLFVCILYKQTFFLSKEAKIYLCLDCCLLLTFCCFLKNLLPACYLQAIGHNKPRAELPNITFISQQRGIKQGIVCLLLHRGQNENSEQKRIELLFLQVQLERASFQKVEFIWFWLPHVIFFCVCLTFAVGSQETR